mgnify:FL=1
MLELKTVVGEYAGGLFLLAPQITSLPNCIKFIC